MYRYTRFFALLIMAAGMLGFASVSAAAQDARFFSSLPDIPLMPGMEEIPDYTVAYDKAVGRFIESVARIDDASTAQVHHYYESSLPHLGWEKVSDQTFMREDEVLQYRIETLEDARYLKITVEPR